MYLITIAIKENFFKDESIAEQRLIAHRNWFSEYYDKGNFLLIGPSISFEKSGIIVAQVENREELENILKKDSYYPGLAEYRINEFTANKIADNFNLYQGN